MGIVRVGLIVMAAALVLAGCVSRTGTAEVLKVPEPARPGDQLDPCSLTGPAAYEPAGTARMPGKPDLDECRVAVATRDGRVVVHVGYRLPVDQLPGDRTKVRDLGRGVTIERVDDGCATALVLASNDTAFLATVEMVGDRAPGKDVQCELAEGAVTGVFNVLVGERATFWTPEPDSLALLDACELLQANSVLPRLDIDGKLLPSGHACRWHGPEGAVSLRFPVAESPDDAGVPDGTPAELIAGRESWVVNTATDCTVYTRHIEFEPGVGTFEFAALTVTRTDPCPGARAAAEEAWAELPS